MSKPKIRFKGCQGEWERLPLSSIVTRVSDTASSQSLPYVEFEDIVSGEGILNKDIKDKKGIKTGNKFVTGDVLFGKLRPYLKNILLANFTGVAVGDFWVLRPNGILPEILYLLVSSNAFMEVANIQSGSKMPRSDWNLVSNSQFDIPPTLPEQRQIAAYFQNLDGILSGCESRLSSLRRLKEGALQAFFPQQGETQPQIRFKGCQGEWESSTFNDVIESFNYGLNVAATQFDGENIYLRITDIDDETRSLSTKQLSSPQTILNKSDEYLLKDGDITVARTGASVGKSYIYHNSDGKIYFAGYLIRMRVKTMYDSDFVFLNTLSRHFVDFIKIVSQRSGQPGVNSKELGLYSFLIPPTLHEQRQIANFFRTLDRRIELELQRLEKLKQLKAACLEKMFV